MSCISRFLPAPAEHALPQQFPSPFSNTPHVVARQAATQLQKTLLAQTGCGHDFSAPGGGTMMGVLVVRDKCGQVGFLSAFAGSLAGRWVLPGFVPPVFDWVEREKTVSASEAELACLEQKIAQLKNSDKYHRLQSRLEQLTAQQDRAIGLLRETHRVRKAWRHEQRRKIELSDSRLAELSLESQRDKRALKEFTTQWRARLATEEEPLAKMNQQIKRFKKSRNHCFNKWRKQCYSTYVLGNWQHEKTPIAHFFANHTPPQGAGDCAAVKLLYYAQQHGLMPIAMAEFWWGASPRGHVRHHGHFYPACRGKCRPVLPFMLKGLDVQPHLFTSRGLDNALATLHEDDDLLVVNKPSGLLSVPGSEVQDSVLTRLKQRYPHATGPLLVHRLDMSTSGLLLVAKKAAIHKALQQQFEQRRIKKRYVAVLSKKLTEQKNKGTIELPLRVDIDDRPRQMVCFDQGKSATTHWEIIAQEQETTRVYFYPFTGRTHQLRVHAAYKDGLNAPIVGDELYGEVGERLLLHAERLCFTHPKTGKRFAIEAPTPF